MALRLYEDRLKEMTDAVVAFKEALATIFTDKEKKKSFLRLQIHSGSRHGGIFLFDDDHKMADALISWGKGSALVRYELQLVNNNFFGKTRVELVAQFSMTQLTGCCGAAVSTGAWVLDKYRQRGLGTLLNSLRLTMARCQGYTILLATAVDDGITEKIMHKNGWERITRFTNYRTENKISMFSHKL